MLQTILYPPCSIGMLLARRLVFELVLKVSCIDSPAVDDRDFTIRRLKVGVFKHSIISLFKAWFSLVAFLLVSLFDNEGESFL